MYIYIYIYIYVYIYIYDNNSFACNGTTRMFTCANPYLRPAESTYRIHIYKA